MSEKRTAIIFDIQKFSIHDGPGVRTLIFLKGCPLNCIWCCNPESQSRAPHLIFYSEKCIRANKCLQVCPAHAISVLENKLVVDENLCDLCGRCAEACYAEAWKIVGRVADVDYIMSEIEEDILFYRNSGGGVTFSGGEPLLYPEFVNGVASRCHSRDIPVAIETCGYVPWRNFEIVLDNIDLVMFDVKHMNPGVHKGLCGQSNDLVLENLRSLSQRGDTELIIRVPIVPELNDDIDNIHDMATFLTSLNGSIKGVEILPYHKLGERKYERLGRKYVPKNTKIPSDDHMQLIKRTMEDYRLTVQIGG